MDLNDNELIAHALKMWANYIETGDMAISAIDARNAKRPYHALVVEQMKLVVRLRELAKEMLNAKS